MASKQAPTDYQVLVADQDGGAWRESKVVPARSPGEAIKAASRDGDHHRGGTYKAVPVRSWKNGLVITTRQTTISEFESLDATPPVNPKPAP